MSSNCPLAHVITSLPHPAVCQEAALQGLLSLGSLGLWLPNVLSPWKALERDGRTGPCLPQLLS